MYLVDLIAESQFLTMGSKSNGLVTLPGMSWNGAQDAKLSGVLGMGPAGRALFLSGEQGPALLWEESIADATPKETAASRKCFIMRLGLVRVRV
jgi:hypothetical protein